MSASWDYPHGFRSYVQACWAESPNTYGPVWFVSVAGLAAVLALSHHHLSALRRQPISARRQLYLTITWLPVVLALTSAAAILAPRSALLWWLLQQQYEAVALSAFGSLLFLLLVLASDGALPGSLGDRMLQRLAVGGARKHFATPPLCCLFRPCWPTFHLGARHLLLVHRMMQQYVLATPLLAILDLWASLSLPPPSAASTRASCLAAKRLSTLLALWALFSLYQATHDALSTWNTTGKFVALKAVLMLELLQEPLIALAVHAADGDDTAPPTATLPALDHSPSAIQALYANATANATAWPPQPPPSSIWPPHDPHDVDTGGEGPGCLGGEALVHFWCSFALLLECLIMAEMMRRAFPARELDRTYLGERQGLLIELELLRHFSEESERELSEASIPLGARQLAAAERRAGGSAASRGAVSPSRWWEGPLHPPRRSLPRLPPLATHHSAPPRIRAPPLSPPPVSCHASAAGQRQARSLLEAALFGGVHQPRRKRKEDGGGTLMV